MRLTDQLIEQVLERDGHACHFCRASGVELTIVHERPVAESTVAPDLVATCSGCSDGWRTCVASVDDMPNWVTKPPRQGWFAGVDYIQGARGWHAMCFAPGCWRDWGGKGRGYGVWMTDPMPTLKAAQAQADKHLKRDHRCAYLIEVEDSKEGVVYPTLIGPFPDAAAANAFKKEWLPDEWGPPNGGRGYYAVHVVADETCHYTPTAYAVAFPWKKEDE